MGLSQVLDYQPRPANAAQRLVQRVASSSLGSKVAQRTLYRIDRPLYRWSRGRISLPGLMAGLPVIMLTTTGARSGQQRTMPLAGVPLGDDLAVLGTNYAQASTPGWVHNLEADPAAAVTYRRRSVPVSARLASDSEAELVWSRAGAIYGGFSLYRQRIQTRQVRIFVLEAL